MVFKFSNDLSLKEAEIKRVIKKENVFNNKIVFVDGFSASGKTMVSPIISSMKNVESLIYPYEIEWISSFLYSNKIDSLSYQEFLVLLEVQVLIQVLVQVLIQVLIQKNYLN